MAVTTNYSWSTPDDTALVKDGAAAIRSLGTAIDTTVFNNASAGIAKTIVDAKGDIIAATAADTVSRLAVGANDTVLTADSTAATGLKWAAVAGGSMTLLSTTSLSGTSTTSISSINQGYKSLYIFFATIACNTNNWVLSVKPNNATTSSQTGLSGSGTYSQASGAIKLQGSGDTSSGNDAFTMSLRFDDYTSALSDTSPFTYYGRFYDYSSTTLKAAMGGGGFYGNTAITSLTIETSAGTFNAGSTVSIYGVN
jgi:hypothetical protein